MNNYETVFILTPVLSEEQAKEAVKNYEAEVKKLGGTIKHSESWGLKRLAYPIQKKTTGFYFLFQIEGEGSLIADLELFFKRDERIMRFLTIKMDRDHLAWAEKRRSRMKEGKPAEKAEA